MLAEYADYATMAIGVVIAAISWVLKKEHNRIESLEAFQEEITAKHAGAMASIDVNNTRDEEWRKAVEANHKGLLKADEDRRNDTRKIFDKIETLKGEIHAEIQRLAEKIAEKK